MYELSLLSPRVVEIADPIYFYRLRSGSAESAVGSENRRRKLRFHVAVAKIMGEYCASRLSDTATVNRLTKTLWYALYDAVAFRQRKPVRFCLISGHPACSPSIARRHAI